MKTPFHTNLLSAASIITSLAILAMLTSNVRAQSHDGHDGNGHAQLGVSHGPHGGQVTTIGEIRAEVVYAQQETRVYLFDAAQRPISARGLQGRITMQVRDNPQPFLYSLTYVQAQREDFLGAPIDVSRIRDGDMRVTIELQGLPGQAATTARFVQAFALSHPLTTVTVGELTAADQVGIQRQGVCPVMQTPLGEHGAPVKLLIDGHPLYVCCKGCISQVQADPQKFLPRGEADAVVRGAENRVNITVSQATQADQGAIQAQGHCVVMTDQQLGGHGAPIKITIGNEALFVCCQGCVGKVQQNPSMYLSRAQQMRIAR